jgi:hypothetical protein
MKVVINTCFGGFGLSRMAVERYLGLKGITVYTEVDKYELEHYWLVAPGPERVMETTNEQWWEMTDEERMAHNARWESQVFYDRDLERNDPLLVQVVEELGQAASGQFAQLEVVEIPDGVEWVIEEYDGNEHVAEKHRTWS